MLSPDESLLLYWYQNALEDGRDTILNRAQMEFHKAQLEIYHRADGIKNTKKTSEPYEQLSLDFSAEKIN